MVNLSSTVFLFAVLQFTSAVPQGGRQASTACVSTSTVFVDFDALLSMAATETDKWSTLAVAESTMVMNGFRSRRKGKNSLYPPIASPSATLLSNSFIVIPGTTEEFKHYSFPESHSSVTLVAMSRLLMPLSKITDPSGMTTSVVASSTSTSTPDGLTSLLMPLPEIVQPTTSPAAPSTGTSTPEDLTPLLMPLPHIIDVSNSTTSLAARSMPHIMEPYNRTTTLAAQLTETSSPEDLTPLPMPLPNIVQPPDESATPTTSSTSSSTPEDLSRLLMPLPNIIDPSGMTTSVVASSTDTPEDLTPLLMPLPEIVQPTNEAATPTPSATQTSVPEDLSPLLMPPSNTVQPRSLIQWVKEKLKCDCKEMLRAAKVVRRGVVDWMAKRLEWLTGKNAEELVSAIKTMHGVDVAVR